MSGTGNKVFDSIVAPLYRKDFAELVHGKKDMPFSGETDDGFITVYVSPPLKD